jgi:hypothetical protein
MKSYILVVALSLLTVAANAKSLNCLRTIKNISSPVYQDGFSVPVNSNGVAIVNNGSKSSNGVDQSSDFFSVIAYYTGGKFKLLQILDRTTNTRVHSEGSSKTLVLENSKNSVTLKCGVN